MSSQIALISIAVFSLSTYAKLKPIDYSKPVSADCVYRGSFSRIEPIKVDGKDLEPVSISVGHFKVKKLVRGEHSLCAKSLNEFDVIFSNGKSSRFGWGDGCTKPMSITQQYEIALNVGLEATFMPSDCHRWVKEIP